MRASLSLNEDDEGEVMLHDPDLQDIDWPER